MVFGMKVDKKVEMAADWLVAIGAANWGLTLFGINLVDMVAGLVNMPIVGTIVYGAVGVAGVYKILDMLGM
jgi:uncharacterized membrane protein YuzA (DUF378 family)